MTEPSAEAIDALLIARWEDGAGEGPDIRREDARRELQCAYDVDFGSPAELLALAAKGLSEEERVVVLNEKSVRGLIVAAQLGAPSPMPPELHEGLTALQKALDAALLPSPDA